MPITNDNPKGNGYADYVLWADDGLPLAVIEAKKASAESAGKSEKAQEVPADSGDSKE